jgi:hypothetical protein
MLGNQVEQGKRLPCEQNYRSKRLLRQIAFDKDTFATWLLVGRCYSTLPPNECGVRNAE